MQALGPLGERGADAAEDGERVQGLAGRGLRLWSGSRRRANRT